VDKHLADWLAGAETVQADINDPDAVAQALRGRQFDVVVTSLHLLPLTLSATWNFSADVPGNTSSSVPPVPIRNPPPTT